MAPLLPLVTEEIWRGLTGGRSVHLADWPDVAGLPSDPGLVAAMDRVRDVCSAAASLRKANGLRVRQPLAALTVAAPGAVRLAPFRSLVADEVNVKDVVLTGEAPEGLVERVLTLVPRALGPRLGADVQRVIKAVRAGDWSADAGGTVTAGGVRLRDGEYELRTVASGAAHAAPLPGRAGGGAGVVVLDTALTPELVAEGLARDVIRVVQTARREAGLDVADRIELTLDVSPELSAALRTHLDVLQSETLTRRTTFAALPADRVFTGETGDGQPVVVRIERA
jgi:isoleucyl-tRNA synthetase